MLRQLLTSGNCHGFLSCRPGLYCTCVLLLGAAPGERAAGRSVQGARAPAWAESANRDWGAAAEALKADCPGAVGVEAGCGMQHVICSDPKLGKEQQTGIGACNSLTFGAYECLRMWYTGTYNALPPHQGLHMAFGFLLGGYLLHDACGKWYVAVGA